MSERLNAEGAEITQRTRSLSHFFNAKDAKIAK